MLQVGGSYIGVDIGGTNIRGALVSAGGTILERFRMPTRIEDGRRSFLERLCEGVEALCAYGDSHGTPVISIGVGVPGLIDIDGMVHSSVNLQPVVGMNLRVMLEERFSIPVFCANDANLIAVGEHRFGAGQGLDTMMVLTIGTGLGSGLILEGRLWEGTRGFASEFGHVTVEPDGRLCKCGNNGCLEQYVSATVLMREGGGASPEELAENARSGNSEAIIIFRRMGRYLGIAVAGLLNTLNLDAILIGGGVSACYDLFEPGMMEAVQNRVFPDILKEVVFCRAALGDDAGLMGAAHLSLTRSMEQLECLHS